MFKKGERGGEGEGRASWLRQSSTSKRPARLQVEGKMDIDTAEKDEREPRHAQLLPFTQ